TDRSPRQEGRDPPGRLARRRGGAVREGRGADVSWKARSPPPTSFGRTTTVLVAACQDHTSPSSAAGPLLLARRSGACTWRRRTRDRRPSAAYDLPLPTRRALDDRGRSALGKPEAARGAQTARRGEPGERAQPPRAGSASRLAGPEGADG